MSAKSLATVGDNRPRRRMLLAGGASLFLTGCGGGGFAENNGGSGGGGTLRMLVNITPNLTKSFWRDLVAEYEKKSGVRVRIEAPTGGGGVRETLPQLLASGDPPDVVETLMVDQRLSEQMQPLTGRSWADGTPLAQEASLDGDIYTVGVGIQAQSLVFYNKQAFAKAGLKRTPRTFEELTATMQALAEAGYLPLQTAGDYVAGLQQLQLATPSILAAHPDWYAAVRAGKITLSETYVPHFRRYREWLDRGFIDTDALGLTDAQAQEAFFAGEAGMYVMGSWLVSSAGDRDGGIPIGAFGSPVENGQQYPGPLSATMAMPYMVLRGSANRSEAARLVRWLVTDPGAIRAQLAQDGNFRTGHDWCDSELCGDVQRLIDEAPSTVSQGEGYGEDTLPPGFNSEFYEVVQGLYVDQSPEAAGERLDAWMEANA